MTSRQLDEEAIFHVARAIPSPEARSAYLDQICANDQALRDRVVRLLDVHEKEEHFLNDDQRLLEPTRTTPRPAECAGSQIGRYRLMEQIGEGGMGVVFVAEQQRPFRRKVAVKVIKPGMDSKAVIARFEAERQALALMDHPNVAKVLDAGTTESGHPYFAMELVRGVPITDYCDLNRLTIKERLQLFTDVCSAIQHAHQKGIIHRDIKPSNVLVTLHDGIPVPKIIDFGVAKALNARLSDKTIYTEHLQVVGTMLYMSPEQAELSGLDVDTRSDIYSLGVLLYELLTGTTPFQKEELDQAGFDEQRRILREKDPPRASVRISSLGVTATAIAEHRKTDARRLSLMVKGDLDWIVLKALEKDRTRRYESAAAFAADVKRSLLHETVSARPPSIRYKSAKFCRRNRFAVGTVTAIITALVTGLLLALAGYRAAESQKTQAIREAEKAQLAVSLFTQMLGTPPPGTTEHAAGGTTEVLSSSVPGMLDAFGVSISHHPGLVEHPDVEANIRMVVGWAVYRFDGNKALDHFRRALELRKANPDDHQLLAQSLFAIGHALVKITPKDYQEVEMYYRKALAEEEATCKGTDSALKAVIFQSLAHLYMQEGQLDKAVRYGNESVRMHARVFGDAHLESGIALRTLSQIYDEMGNATLAIKYRRNAVEVFRRGGYVNGDWGNCLQLGKLLQKHGDIDGAITAYRNSLNAIESGHPADHKKQACSIFFLADASYANGNLELVDRYLSRFMALADRESSVKETDNYIDAVLLNVSRLAECDQTDKAVFRLNEVCEKLQKRMASGEEVESSQRNAIKELWKRLKIPANADKWQLLLEPQD
jgi:serine/threonine protein kinase/tetratricopeptide (TPR) repeat protein